LDLIIADLEALSPGESVNLVEMKAAIRKMKSIGKTNPLLSLVEFSSTFDENTLNEVI